MKNYKKSKYAIQFAYVLEGISNPEQEEEMSDKEKVQYFFECFNSEFNYEHNRKIIPNLQERISQYIQGLPNCIAVAYTNEQIINVGKSWNYCNTEKESTKFVDRWFSVLAFRLIQLKECFNI